LRSERKELEDEKGKLKDEKGKAELGSNLQMQSLRSRIERLNLQLTDANKHRTELEENKIQQNLKLDEMTNELNETKKKLLVLENSKQVISEKELCESLQYATTQTSRIVLLLHGTCDSVYLFSDFYSYFCICSIIVSKSLILWYNECA
jgi:chromosome segregation ATPase